MVQDNTKLLAEAETIAAPPLPEWASPNHVLLDLDTMRLRDSRSPLASTNQLPVITDAPYAGHSATMIVLLLLIIIALMFKPVRLLAGLLFVALVFAIAHGMH